jgi:hypothetical protein
MPNNESVGKKIVEALKKQAENMDVTETDNGLFDVNNEIESVHADVFASSSDDILSETTIQSSPSKSSGFFDDVEEEKEPFFAEPTPVSVQTAEPVADGFEMPANIAVLKKLISQLPSGVSRHTGAQIIKQTMEALGISMKSVLQDAQQVQEGLKVSARECQASIQEYKKQILALEKQSQSYQKQYSALNDLISLFIQTTK